MTDIRKGVSRWGTPIALTLFALVLFRAILFVGYAGTKRHECDQRRKDRQPVSRKEPARQPVPAGSVEIYVGNLSYDLTDDSLKGLFAEYGEVASARVVTNRFNGKSKGFGFVVMPNRSEAEKAIAAYSEKDYMGRKMRVNEAKNTITE